MRQFRPEDAVRKLVSLVWTRIAKFVTTKQALDMFIAHLISAFEESAADQQPLQVAMLTSAQEAAPTTVIETRELTELIVSPLPVNPVLAL